MKSEDLLMACFENGKEPDRGATFTCVNGNVSCFAINVYIISGLTFEGNLAHDQHYVFINSIL